MQPSRKSTEKYQLPYHALIFFVQVEMEYCTSAASMLAEEFCKIGKITICVKINYFSLNNMDYYEGN